ncbi:LytR/AlgR family response regulator transcription factor [Pseudonocardia sp.]|uniref:LytR/AlgR family response regulator transcription factor n=1 Tax=Pseudonocardia sp. TaxID=60912 RepID=UPI003D1236AF
MGDAGGLVVLAVDDEEPALDELALLLGEQPGVGTVLRASDAAEAMRIVDGNGSRPVDVVFSDIHMPGLDGMELARHCAGLADPPAIVFVTANDTCALDAYEVGVVDYVLKPVRSDRLRQALRRAPTGRRERPAVAGRRERPTGEVVAVELGGHTTLVPRDAVRCVVAEGDYVRLHTPAGSHLLRVPLSVLEERWAGAGFLRVHRSYLVAASAISALCPEGDGHVLVLGAGPQAMRVPVSRRRISQVRRMLRGEHGRRSA